MRDLYFDFGASLFEDWIKISEINITIKYAMFNSTCKIKKWEVLWHYKHFSYSSFVTGVVDLRFD